MFLILSRAMEPHTRALPTVNVGRGYGLVGSSPAPPASSGTGKCLPYVNVAPNKQRAPRNDQSTAKLPSTERKRKLEPVSGGVTSQKLQLQQAKAVESNKPKSASPTVRSTPNAPSQPQSKRRTPPYWRANAQDELPLVATLFGEDLRDVAMPASGGSVPSSWTDYDSCLALLTEHGISPSRIDVLEVYAGSGNFTDACRNVGLLVGPPSTSNMCVTGSWDLLTAKWRRVLWAIVVVCKPRWIHWLPSRLLAYC